MEKRTFRRYVSGCSSAPSKTSQGNHDAESSKERETHPHMARCPDREVCMTENSQSPVQSMLLAAPKEVRLDLAIASLLYSVRRELVEVAVGSQRRIAPVYYFFDAQRNYPTFFFSPNHLNLPPWQPGKPPPDPVPSYASDTQSSWAVRDFVQCVTLTYYQKVLSVVVTNGTQVWEERATITSHMYRERETCRLIALATLHVYAPDLLPVLDADQQEEQMKEVLAGAPRTTHQIQEIVLAPALRSE